MTNVPLIIITKWGISDKVKRRVVNVSETTTGRAVTVLDFKLAFGWECEQVVHALYFWANVNMGKKASGGSEWFLNISPLTCLGAWYVCHKIGYHLSAGTLTLLAITPVFWLDGLLWLLLFALGRALIYILTALALLYFCANVQ
jgi:hypothetical protein